MAGELAGQRIEIEGETFLLGNYDRRRDVYIGQWQGHDAEVEMSRELAEKYWEKQYKTEEWHQMNYLKRGPWKIDGQS